MSVLQRIIITIALCGVNVAAADSLRDAIDRDYRENLAELYLCFHQNPEPSIKSGVEAMLIGAITLMPVK